MKAIRRRKEKQVAMERKLILREFKKIDTDNGGTLDANEMMRLLRNLGKPKVSGEVRRKRLPSQPPRPRAARWMCSPWILGCAPLLVFDFMARRRRRSCGRR